MFDHDEWSLTRNRKQKNMSNVWPKKWSRLCEKIDVVYYKRVFKKAL